MTFIQKGVELIGNKGIYQKILMGFLICCYIELGLMLFGSTFVFMNPIFDCGPAYDNPSEDEACPIIKDCTLGISFLRKKILILVQDMPISIVKNQLKEILFNHQSILDLSLVS